MGDYNLKQLMAMDNDALAKAAKSTFSMQFDPFSELGQRTMNKRMAEANCLNKPNRISPGVAKVIGIVAVIIENILHYQDAMQNGDNQSAAR